MEPSEDEQFSKDTSSFKSESGDESIQLPISLNVDPTQSNNQKYDETGHSAEFTKGSRSKVQNENLTDQESSSSVCSIGKDLASNSSFTVSDEIMNGSESMLAESMLSFTSTDAICGSPSSDITSSENQPLSEPEENSVKCESERIWYLDDLVLNLPGRTIKIFSKSQPTTPSSDTNKDNKSQKADNTSNSAKISFKEDYSPFKSPEKANKFEAAALPSLPNGRFSKNIKAEVPPKMPLSSTLACFSDMEETSSNENTTTLLPIVPCLTTEEDKTSDIFSDCSAKAGFTDNNCKRRNICMKEDDSVRKKVKTEPPTSSKTDSLPSSCSSVPSTCGSARQIGRLLLLMSETLKQTSPEEDDWDLYGGEERNFSYFIWEDYRSLGHKLGGSYDSQKLGRRLLLKELRDFFQQYRVNVDLNMSWREIKNRIVTSKYFSDEFARRHGLLTHEELMKESLKDLERYTSPVLSQKLELLELCKTLMESGIPEETFIEYYRRKFLEKSGGEKNMEPFNRQSEDNSDELFLWIEEEFDNILMLNLYSKLEHENATYVTILNESKKLSAAEERSLGRGLLQIAENSSNISYDQSIVFTNLPTTRTLIHNESENTSISSNRESHVFHYDEFTIESSEVHLRESDVSMSDSNSLDSYALAKNEVFNEKTFLSENKVNTESESSDELGTGKEESNVSAEGVYFKDRTENREE